MSVALTQKPKPFDFSGNTSVIEFQCSDYQAHESNYGLLLKIFCEDADNASYEIIYNQMIPLLNRSTGKISLQINDKLHDYISYDIGRLNPDIPVLNFLECKKSCRRYYLEFYEVIDGIPQAKQTTEIFTALHGALSKRAQITSSLLSILQPGSREIDRFLKQGPRMIYTHKEQIQFLYFFNTRSTILNAELKVRYFFTDKTEVSIVMTTFNLEEKRKYAFNVTFDSFYSSTSYPGREVSHYEVWLGKGDSRYSEIRTYYVNNKLKKHIRYFLNWSSFGSMDTRVCYGEGTTEIQITQRTSDRIGLEFDIQKASSFVFDLNSQSRFSVTTGFMSKAELVLWRDFYLSAFKYRLVSGLLIPVALLTENIKEIEDGSLLHSNSFEYRYLNEEYVFTEGDIEDAGGFYKDILFYNQTTPEGALVTEDGKIIFSEAHYFIKK